MEEKNILSEWIAGGKKKWQAQKHECLNVHGKGRKVYFEFMPLKNWERTNCGGTKKSLLTISYIIYNKREKLLKY